MLLELKCLVFSEDGCKNIAKFYIEFCIKYRIPYAGSMIRYVPRELWTQC